MYQQEISLSILKSFGNHSQLFSSCG